MASLTVNVTARKPWTTKARMKTAAILARLHLPWFWLVSSVRWQYRIGNGKWRDMWLDVERDDGTTR